MKKLSLVLMLAIAFVACKNAGTNETQIIDTSDPTIVNVFYFHGKQRCKTCNAVQDVAKETIKTTFANNDKVRFIEINTSEKGNEALIEKYEVTWNALIIAKGEDFIEITDHAFATAVKNPQSLRSLIIGEVTKRLMNNCCDAEKLALCDKALTCEKCCKVDCCKILTGKTTCATPDKMPCDSDKSSCSTDKKGCC
jgi:hypothetical protein